VKERLERVPVPVDAEERAWAVVRAAFAEREHVVARRRIVRPLLVLAAVLAVVAAAVSSPGRAVLDSLRDSIAGEQHAAPALFSLPASGRLLVDSTRGTWVVHRDGSKRLLGSYSEASWSPQGKFVVAIRGHELFALEPAKGGVRWSLARRGRLTHARWSPDGFRIAYLAGHSLRVVAGDGTGDHLLVRRAAPEAAIWVPGTPHVLAYLTPGGVLRVVDPDTNTTLSAFRVPILGALDWSRDAAFLTIRSDRLLFSMTSDGTGVQGISTRSLGSEPNTILASAFAPRGHAFAFVTRDRTHERSIVSVELRSPRLERQRRVFSALGTIDQIAWSPDGRWLVVGLPGANQWVFVRARGPGLRAVSNVSEQFGGSFPMLRGWCC
jgi:WD40-like Beta Propeller Repeat